MKCPLCVIEGKKSSVSYDQRPKTMTMEVRYNTSYWDEDGKYHNHNHSTSEYQCTNGHYFGYKNHCDEGDCCDEPDKELFHD